MPLVLSGRERNQMLNLDRNCNLIEQRAQILDTIKSTVQQQLFPAENYKLSSTRSRFSERNISRVIHPYDRFAQQLHISGSFFALFFAFLSGFGARACCRRRRLGWVSARCLCICVSVSEPSAHDAAHLYIFAFRSPRSRFRT